MSDKSEQPSASFTKTKSGRTIKPTPETQLQLTKHIQDMADGMNSESDSDYKPGEEEEEEESSDSASDSGSEEEDEANRVLSHPTSSGLDEDDEDNEDDEKPCDSLMSEAPATKRTKYT